MSKKLKALKVTWKSGNEAFTNSENVKADLLGFWRWSASDLVSNTLRGVLAEYIIALDLGITQENPRVEWDAYDLETSDGINIEVKSSAYLQSWYQKELSQINFGIAPRLPYDPQTGEFGEEKVRSADVYVFALLHHKDKDTVDPLNLSQWTFYILSTSVMNEKILTQETITLSSLLKLHPIETGFGGIRVAIDQVLNSV